MVLYSIKLAPKENLSAINVKAPTRGKLIMIRTEDEGYLQSSKYYSGNHKERLFKIRNLPIILYCAKEGGSFLVSQSVVEETKIIINDQFSCGRFSTPYVEEYNILYIYNIIYDLYIIFRDVFRIKSK